MLIILISNYLKSVKSNILKFKKEKKLFFWWWIALLISFELVLTAFMWAVFFFIINYFPWWFIFVPKLAWIMILIIFNFLIISSIISSVPNLYKNKEIDYLISQPIRYNDIFLYWMFKNLLYISIWATLILIPFFLGMWIVNKYWFGFYLISLFIIISIILTSWILGSLIFLVITKSIVFIKNLLKNRLRQFLTSISLIWLIGLLIHNIRQLFNITEEWEKVFETIVINFDYNQIFLPYNRFTKLIANYLDGNILAILISVFFITITVVFLYQTCLFFSERYYFDSIQNLKNFNLFKRKKNTNINSRFKFKTSLNLILKDLLTHIKDPTQRSQFFIFFVLILVYLVVIKWINLRDLENPKIIGFISLINIRLTWFLIWAVAIRFVYPNISLEWKSFWILKTLPLRIKKFYHMKLLFFCSLFLILGIIMSKIYINILWIIDNIGYLIMISVIPMIIFTICFYFMLGVLYPDFKENNPSKIATSIPGIMAILFSNLFIISVSFPLKDKLIHYYEQLHQCNHISLKYFLPEILIIYIVSILFILLFNKIGYKKLKNIEI